MDTTDSIKRIIDATIREKFLPIVAEKFSIDVNELSDCWAKLLGETTAAEKKKEPTAEKKEPTEKKEPAEKKRTSSSSEKKAKKRPIDALADCDAIIKKIKSNDADAEECQRLSIAQLKELCVTKSIPVKSKSTKTEMIGWLMKKRDGEEERCNDLKSENLTTLRIKCGLKNIPIELSDSKEKLIEMLEKLSIPSEEQPSEPMLTEEEVEPLSQQQNNCPEHSDLTAVMACEKCNKTKAKDEYDNVYDVETKFVYGDWNTIVGTLDEDGVIRPINKREMKMCDELNLSYRSHLSCA